MLRCRENLAGTEETVVVVVVVVVVNVSEGFLEGP
jgi:hypothetical protein